MKTKNQSGTGNWVVRLALSMAFALWVVLNTSSAMASSGTLHITSSTTLTEDHYGNVFIEGNDITLDCAYRTVFGPGVSGFSGGISIGNSTGVTGKRCLVTGFDVNGIFAGANAHGRYERNRVFNNRANGIHIDQGDGDIIVENTCTGNAWEGIILTAGTKTWIEGNKVQNNGAGIGLIRNSHENLVVKNIALRNGAGFALDEGAFNNVLSNNTSNHNGQGFAIVRGSNGNNLFLNTANENIVGFEVSYASTDNLVSGNTANKNQADGFKIYSANNNTMLRNTAIENGNGGFMVFGGASFNRVERNFARGNVFSDGYDEGTGTGNIWLANRFGTTIGF
jgi:parallel beta-helix repeat protein